MLAIDVNWLLFGETHKKDIGQVPPEGEWSNFAPRDGKTPLDNDEVEVPFLKDMELACCNGKCMGVDYNGFKLRFSKATLKRIGDTK